MLGFDQPFVTSFPRPPRLRPATSGQLGGLLQPGVPLTIDARTLLRQKAMESSESPAGAGLGFQEEIPIQRSPTRPATRGPRRDVERAWIRAHSAELRGLAGNWAVIEGEELVTWGPDAASVVGEARARGVAVPFIIFIDDPESDTIKIGL